MLIPLLWVLVASPGPVFSASDNRTWLSTATVVSLDIANNSFYRALDMLGDLEQFKFNTAFVIPDRDGLLRPKFSVKLTSVSVATVLDAVTAADGNFKWDYTGRILHFTPRSAEAYERFPALRVLDARLDFKATAPNMRLLNERLREAAEKQGLPLYGHPKSNSQRADSCMEYEHPKGLSVDSKGGTVRDVLDAIVESDPPSGWSVFPWSRDTRAGIFILISSGHSHGCPSGTRSPSDFKDGAPSTISPPAREQR